MAAGALGHVDPFDEALESWTNYAERLEQFLVANKITTEDRMRAVFLSLLGPKHYQLLRNLVAPAKPTEKTYQELIKVLSNHFSPPPSEIVERYKFNTTVRRPGQSISEFVSDLRAKAQYCNYAATLEMMLRDRLVCRIQDETMQRRLLAEPGL